MNPQPPDSTVRPASSSEPSPARIAARLNQLLAEAQLQPLHEEVAAQFAAYLALLQRWNARTNLTAIRDEEGILSRHFVESIACAQKLPCEIRTLLDFGSGGGFPGIPIALCRLDIQVTLAESQGKKAAFLREAVRTLGLQVAVHGARAEQLQSRYDCVILRAVDRMREAVRAASTLVGPGGWLAIVTTTEDLPIYRAGLTGGFDWQDEIRLPGSNAGVLALAKSLPGRSGGK